MSAQKTEAKERREGRDTVSVVLADDHNIVRRGLKTLLEFEPDFRVVGEAGNGLDALELVRRLQPNVLVIDLMMPGMNGLAVARQVNVHSPQTRVVVLSMYANEAYVLEALRTGAKAYVLKESTADELVQAIRQAAAGRIHLSPLFYEHAINAYLEKGETTVFDPYLSLTTRERQVLQLIAECLSNVEIAQQLSIKPRTVDIHRAHVMRKLGLHSQTELARYALRRWIHP